MAIEVDVDTGDNLPEGQEQQTQAAPEVSEVEQRAREQGWVPKEEWHGEGKWRDAEAFLDRGELFGKIDSQNKELRSIRETLNQFKNHHKKVQETAYKKALSDLRAAKKDALIEGDPDKVIEVDEQIQEVREAQAQIEQSRNEHVPQEEHPVFANWREQNTWYDNTKKMRLWADARGLELGREGHSPLEVLKQISKEAKEEFPERFSNPNRSKPGAVESTSGRQGKSAADTYTPSEIERTMARKFVKQGLFKNEQEYYNELRSM